MIGPSVILILAFAMIVQLPAVYFQLMQEIENGIERTPPTVLRGGRVADIEASQRTKTGSGCG
jgi:hypothetical protein